MFAIRLLNFTCCLLVIFSSCRMEKEPETGASEGLIDVNGVAIYYRTMGEGEPLLIIHGGPMLDHTYLLPGFAELARDYQLIFFDQRLSGRSQAEVDTNSLTLTALIDDIEGVRQTLELGKVHLLGHSWGGLLAMRYALRYPEHLRTLILSNSVAASDSLWQAEEALLAERFTPADDTLRRQLVQSEDFLNQKPAAIAELFRISFRKQFAQPELVDSLRLELPDDFMARSSQFQYLSRDSSFSRFDLHNDLTDLTIPTLLIYGDYEPSARLAAPALAESLPNDKLIILENCGHFPFVEQPDAFFQAIRRFLAEVR